MKHLFEVNIAEQYGVTAAILLENIGFWIKTNEANQVNYYDGNYWTYNSRRAYAEMFPYMSARQIEGAFNKLISAGIIITGNYNKSGYDRTLWYALTEKGKSILHFDGMDNNDMQNGNIQNVKPIPDINSDITANIIPNKDAPKPPEGDWADEIREAIEYLNLKAGTHYRTETPDTRRRLKRLLLGDKKNKIEPYTLDDIKSVIDKKCAEWMGTEREKFLRPETLFGGKFEGYTNEKPAKPNGVVSADTAPKKRMWYDTASLEMLEEYEDHKFDEAWLREHDMYHGSALETQREREREQREQRERAEGG